MVVEIEVQSTSVFRSGEKTNCTVMGIIYNVCMGVIAYFFLPKSYTLIISILQSC